MPDATIHPTPQELTAFGLGKLPERAAAVVASHLESCAACRQAVAGVSADSFLNKLRDAKQDRTALPPSLAQPPNVPSSAERPVIAVVPCPNVPPELASHPKYLILRELNRGGMGVVYQARQTMMNRQVVIKVVNRSLLDRPGALERFRREVQAAAQLSHPNIVTAYDAEQAGELHMLVMEFVPGQSLAEVLEKEGPLPVRYACYYMCQAAKGLQHAYEQGMVHRDIKPGNLMLTPKKQIKILDFGLAKVISERDKGKGLTSSDACMGTPEYIAPEQAQNAAKADIRADLYSLGCTLYCLLAGRPPFREDTWMNTVLAHIQKEPPPLTELRADVPERLWRVVARLLAKDPAQRYQKPIEVVQALAPFVKPRATPAPAVNSPVKATNIATDTNQNKKVLQQVTGKAPPNQAPVKSEAASPNADVAVSASLTLTRDPRRNGKKGCVLTAVVSASLALTLMLIAGIIIKVKLQYKDPGKPEPSTAEAIVMLEIDQPGAEVFVDGQRQITVNVPGDGDPIKIKLEPGAHKLRISKAGFVAVTKDIELTAGKSKPIRIRLEPEPPAPSEKPENKDKERWVSLFNGKNLTGWETQPQWKGDWHVENGAIIWSSLNRSELRTERSAYRDFHLRAELRISDGQYAQLFVRGEGGYVIALNSTNGNPRKTGSLFAPSRGWMCASKAPPPPDQWFTLDVIAKENHVAVKVNGQTTADYEDSAPRFARGPITLAAAGHDREREGSLEYRKIEIKELK